MMRAVVALLVSVSLLGCFPHNPKARTFAKAGEGAAILAGIGLSALAGTSADCDEMAMPGVDNSSCHSRAKWLNAAGVVLIVGGLIGFVATVSTAEEEKPKVVEIKDVTPAKAEPKAAPPEQAPPPAETENTQATDPDASGSASPAPSAPQR